MTRKGMIPTKLTYLTPTRHRTPKAPAMPSPAASTPPHASMARVDTALPPVVTSTEYTTISTMVRPKYTMSPTVPRSSS